MGRIMILLLGSFIFVNAAIPTTAGWYQIPNTMINSVCANSSGCTGVFAWSSGVFDTKHNRMIVWGGGHGDYSGNELYSLNLDSLTMTRLTNPAPAQSCIEALAGGTQPNSRHTYDGLAYMENVDRMFVEGGFNYGGSCDLSVQRSKGTWTYDFTGKIWERKIDAPTGLGNYEGQVSAYDPVTGKVFVAQSGYYSYDYATNTYQSLASSGANYDYHCTAVIDPKRRKFVVMGNGFFSVGDISNPNLAWQNPTTTGGSAIVSSAYPGLAYDPIRDRIVAWSGGNTVYSLNMDTKVWTATTNTGGPGSANGTGTYKRWGYCPSKDLFVLVNGADQNAFTFRFPGSGANVNRLRTSNNAIQIQAGPNPVSGNTAVQIRLSGKMSGAISIIDAAGRVVFQGKAQDQIRWGHEKTAPGVYVVRLTSENKVLSQQKLVILE
jgi:hypothetical protein